MSHNGSNSTAELWSGSGKVILRLRTVIFLVRLLEMFSYTEVLKVYFFDTNKSVADPAGHAF
jgi:hypothetical protein